VLLSGMPAVNSLTFVSPVGIPATNNHDEIALAWTVKDATGLTQPAFFFRGPDGKLVPVLLSDQELPGGGKMSTGGAVTVNDAGAVGFYAGVKRPGETVVTRNAYLWEGGTLTPVAVVGQDVVGGGKIGQVTGVRLNNQNRAVLIAARSADTPTQSGLYR